MTEKWRRVEDELPKNLFTGTVLWFYDGVRVYEQELGIIDSYNAKQKMWYLERRITHWMYYKKPEPPISKEIQRDVSSPVQKNGEIDFLPRYDYDDEADVIYISFGEPQKCKTSEDEYGLLVRHTLNGKLNGITIIGFKRMVMG